MTMTEQVESYRFWEIVSFLASEKSLNESIVARALAASVVRRGLVMNSVDPHWLKVHQDKLEIKGSPYVGYCAMPSGEMMVLRSDVLAHLLAVVEQGQLPSRDILKEEFIIKSDYRSWALCSDEQLPHFWFGAS